MHTKLSIPERLKDLRVVDKRLTLEQLAEQTGLSKSALSKYESDDYKDISPFAIATLAEFYGVSTDYLMGLSENKNHPNTELQALHLSDDMVTLLSSGKINNRLLCEIATHENFQRLMTDIEIFVDRIADMRIAQMNLVLEATRQEVIRSHSPGDNDLYVRTLELGQVQESDFFSHTIHDDLDSIVQDVIRSHAPGENDLYVRTLELGQVQENDFSATRFMMIWTASFRIFVRPMSPTAPPPIHSRPSQRSRKNLTVPCSWAVTRNG